MKAAVFLRIQLLAIQAASAPMFLYTAPKTASNSGKNALSNRLAHTECVVMELVAELHMKRMSGPSYAAWRGWQYTMAYPDT